MTDNPAPPPASPPPFEPVLSDGLSPENFRDEVQWGLDRGVITRAQADHEMQAAGNTLALKETPKPPAPGELPAPETPAPSATDYELPNVTELHNAMVGKAPTSAELVKTQETVAGWFTEAQISPEVGKAMGKHAAQHLAAYPKWEALPEVARTTHRMNQEAILRSTWGDKTAENIELARAVAQRVEQKHPGLMDYLDRTGLGNHAQIVITLANHGRALMAK